MAKYLVKKKFRDKETKKVYQAGQEIDMTVKRAEEAVENLKKYGGTFLERIDNKKDNGDGTGQTEQGDPSDQENDQEGGE